MALVTLMKTPLLIWSNRRSCKILRGFGAISLILRRGWGGELCSALARRKGGLGEDAPPQPDDKVDLGFRRDVKVASGLWRGRCD